MVTSGWGRVRGVTSESFGLPAPQWRSRRTGSQCSDPTPRDKGALSLLSVFKEEINPETETTSGVLTLTDGLGN